MPRNRQWIDLRKVQIGRCTVAYQCPPLVKTANQNAWVKVLAVVSYPTQRDQTPVRAFGQLERIFCDLQS